MRALAQSREGLQPPALELERVTKCFRQPGQRNVVALDDVSLRVEQREFLIIVGHNGSGKTTLMNILAGIVEPDSGIVRFRGGTNGRVQARTARVRQTPGDGTFGDLTVRENFQLFLLERSPSPVRTRPPADVIEEAVRRLRTYSLDGKLDQRVSELSQGQRQLLALELAMSRRPQLLLLDEHTASLDRANAAACMEATERLAQESNTTVLMVTHNFGHAIRYGDALVVMRDGRVVHRFAGEVKRDLSLEVLMGYCGFMS